MKNMENKDVLNEKAAAAVAGGGDGDGLPTIFNPGTPFTIDLKEILNPGRPLPFPQDRR